MKIISWNVNGIRACLDKTLPDFILKQKADVFCVQETKAQNDQIEFPYQDYAYQEMLISSAEKKGYSGTLSLLKEKSKKTNYGIGISKFDNEGRFVISNVKGIDIYNIYFPNGAASPERHQYKMDFLSAIHKHLKNELKAGKDIVVLGDYNIAHTEIDIHDPKRLDGTSGFMPEERQWMDEFFDLGFVDSFRKMNPKKLDAYSWWSYRAGARQRNKGWRIDYISTSPSLEKSILRAEIMPEITGSDHCPILLELK